MVDESQYKIAIKEIPKPTPAKGEVLVKVKAAALNHRDQWCRMGMYPSIQYETTLSSDGAGIVEMVVEGVSTDWVNESITLIQISIGETVKWLRLVIIICPMNHDALQRNDFEKKLNGSHPTIKNQ